MKRISRILGSSVFRKQLVAITGLAMVGFIIAHLSGNLLVFGGPDAFNAYAERLAGFGGLLWVMRIGLLAALIVHVWLTVLLVRENRRARGDERYFEYNDHGERTWAMRTMIYTGLLILLFVPIHLNDYTFADKTGVDSVIPGVNNDESLHLFGVLWNSYTIGVGILPAWARIVLYVLAVSAVGFHLSHGIQSLFQTLGFNHRRYTPIIKWASIALGVIVAVGFASIPIFIVLAPEPFGV